MRIRALAPAIAFAALCFGIFLDSPGSSQPKVGKVFVVPVKGEIERGLAFFIRRSLARAEKEGAKAFVLDMDTPGGELGATEEIMEALFQTKVETYTYVNRQAISAGALIAVATRHIYMAQASNIGAAAPVIISPVPTGGPVQVPEAFEEKITSYTRSLMGAAAEKNGHPRDIAEAMVDRDKEIKGVIEKGKLLTLTSEDAASEKIRLSEGTLATLDDLIKKLNAHEVEHLAITWSEQVARFLTQSTVRGLLLLAGLLGLYLEIKTPGFGAPGTLAIICFVLFFFGQYVAGLAGWGDVLLFLLGVILILTEVFLIPGFGVTGALGLLCLMASLFMAMTRFYRPIAGYPWWEFPEALVAFYTVSGVVIGTGAGAVLLFKYLLPKTPAWEGKLGLLTSEKKESGFTVADSSHAQYIGQRGIAETQLRPSGKARFKDAILDVVTEGELIPRGAAIQVLRVEGNRIIVTTTEEPRGG